MHKGIGISILSLLGMGYLSEGQNRKWADSGRKTLRRYRHRSQRDESIPKVLRQYKKRYGT